MKKNKKIDKKIKTVTIEQGLEFIESFQKVLADQDEKTVAISLRIPKNILSSVKFKAQTENKKYQSLIIEYIRQGLKIKP